MLLLLCLLLLLRAEFLVSGSIVRGAEHQNVTLHCTYHAKKAISSMCWGRGECPSFGCSNEILKTDGWKVTSKQPPKFSLKGNISEGNVSLTIEDVRLSDSGVYCCRVEIPGWFNDEKYDHHLEVDPAPTSPSSTSASVFSWQAPNSHQEHTTVSFDSISLTSAAGQSQQSDISALLTVSILPDSIRRSEEVQESPRTTNTTLYVLVPVLVLTLAALVTGIYFKRQQMNKILQSVRTIGMGSKEPVGIVSALENPANTEDNIYILE
ncbi:hepatitis A virus cellular receptor 2 isoform X2 [Ambystoma mexicanum]|uniref:hepatitis A virus cellular receptor 2 isoform X2 n=1 Tax=Ambystoma mexicanum TaxID=8296 RepID=UPI0037E9B151